MSEVKSCKHGRNFCLECHQAGSELKTAQSELAALREELRFIRGREVRTEYSGLSVEAAEWILTVRAAARGADTKLIQPYFENRSPELAELQATIARLTAELKDFQWGASVEAQAGDEARREVAALKAEIERLKGGQGEAQVIGRVYTDDGVTKCELNSIGRSLPDYTPLYASQPAPVSVVPETFDVAGDADQLIAPSNDWLHDLVMRRAEEENTLPSSYGIYKMPTNTELTASYAIAYGLSDTQGLDAYAEKAKAEGFKESYAVCFSIDGREYDFLTVADFEEALQLGCFKKGSGPTPDKELNQ